MDPERWARIETAFAAALEAVPEGREAVILSHCDGDGELAARVRLLLEAHFGPGPLADLPASASPEEPPERLGPYRIIRLLGEGGMGAVYLAEREGAGFTQKVALKLIRAGAATGELARRLEAERAILARLDHQGIARLIDGGTLSGGAPFVAMEYVEGESLVRYCDAQRAGIADRLRLALGVCAALHHAHQQLVVHRDLKPGNILVTRAGRVKLLDFGIAKVLDPGSAAAGARTVPWFTPEYSSPEQLRNEQVTTLSDVYSLGVLVYELLCGVRPHDLAGRTAAEVERIVCEAVPPAPSARALEGPQAPARAAARGLTPQRLRRALAGDLDLIVLKALAKEPSRRYGSVEEFAEELRRWLEGMPVRARPDSAAYRARKFVARHRAAALAVTLAATGVVGGLAVAVWQQRLAVAQRDVAEAALRQAEDVTSYLVGLFEASQPQSAGADTLAARAILRHGLLMADSLAERPAVQARLLASLGEVQHALARYDAADSLLSRALAMQREALGEDHPDVAATLDRLGRLVRDRGRLDEAERHFRAARSIRLRAYPPTHPAQAASLVNLALVHMDRAEPARAESLYGEAVAIQRRAHGPRAAEVAVVMRPWASAARRKGDVALATARFAEAVVIMAEARGDSHPLTAELRVHHGDALALRGDTAAAEQLYRRALGEIERARGPRHTTLVHVLGNLAALATQTGRLREAEELQRRVLDITRTAYGADHPNATILAGVARVVALQGRHAEAESLLVAAIAHQQRVLGEHRYVALNLMELGDIRLARGDSAAARGHYREALELLERTVLPTYPTLGLLRRKLAALS
jgi:tetratricopeptide (TPR) repeat protein/predicted Ser/Thr protein kinase